MLGEAELKGFIPAAVMPERPSFFRRRYIPIKNVPRRDEPDAEPFFVSSMELSGRNGNGRRSPRAKGAVFSGRCVLQRVEVAQVRASLNTELPVNAAQVDTQRRLGDVELHADFQIFHAGLHQFGDFAFAGRQLFKRIFLNDRHKRLFQRPPRVVTIKCRNGRRIKYTKNKPRMAPMVSKCMNSACELR